jgi:outer membrane protein OmpA-like peptidoglycan-associated protein
MAWGERRRRRWLRPISPVGIPAKTGYVEHLIRDHPAVTITIVTAYLSLLGFVHEYYIISRFGIDYSNFATTTDFLSTSLRYVILVVALVLASALVIISLIFTVAFLICCLLIVSDKLSLSRWRRRMRDAYTDVTSRLGRWRFRASPGLEPIATKSMEAKVSDARRPTPWARAAALAKEALPVVSVALLVLLPLISIVFAVHTTDKRIDNLRSFFAKEDDRDLTSFCSEGTLVLEYPDEGWVYTLIQYLNPFAYLSPDFSELVSGLAPTSLESPLVYVSLTSTERMDELLLLRTTSKYSLFFYPAKSQAVVVPNEKIASIGYCGQAPVTFTSSSVEAEGAPGAATAEQLDALHKTLKSIVIALQAPDKGDDMPGPLVEAIEHFAQALENVADAVQQGKAPVTVGGVEEKLDLIHTALSDIGRFDVLAGLSALDLDGLAAKLNELTQAVGRIGDQITMDAESSNKRPFYIPVTHMHFQTPAAPDAFVKWDSNLARCERVGKAILFSSGSTEIKGAKNAEALWSIAEEISYRMQKYTEGDYVLSIGYADGVGNVLANLRLSEGRAEEVMRKIDEQIKLDLYGDSKKLSSAVGRGEGFQAEEQSPTEVNENNRRVEVWYCGANGEILKRTEH